MKILVIFTGGTIGSTVSGDYISPDSSKAYTILQKYSATHSENVEWDTLAPYTILSENISPKTYEVLAQVVKENITKDYAGIIITHGSDTLQYTAAFLDYILGTECIPVMLVSSNYVLEDERANGMYNFEAAVDFILNKRGTGVFVPYKNTGEDCVIHRGINLLPHMPFGDSLYSFNDNWYGKYTEGKFINNIFNKIEKRVAHNEPNEYNDVSGVVIVYQYPGMMYPILDNRVKAVVLFSYHSGTIRTASEQLDYFMKQTHERGIRVYLVGAQNGTDYESCKAYEDLGVTVLREISPIAAYIKTWIELYN